MREGAREVRDHAAMVHQPDTPRTPPGVAGLPRPFPAPDNDRVHVVPGTTRPRAVRVLVRPVQAFVQVEAAGGIVLVAAAIIALLWANSPWPESYTDFWHTTLAADLGFTSLSLDLHGVVNDGAMALFFFIVGLEIKRELVSGELASPRRAALPVFAAVGGMVLPAGIYLLFNAGHESSHGWGIPMATDIAFALGVLALLGPRVPFALKVFLLALAIVDDLGAIAVIAVFYSESVALEPVLWGAGVVAAILLLRSAGVRDFGPYAVLGVLLWLAVYKSGIHATIAGVILAALTPAREPLAKEDFEPLATGLIAQYRESREAGDEEGRRAALGALFSLEAARTSPLDRLEHALHVWASFVVVPVFALANSGLDLSETPPWEVASSRVGLGVFLGLLVGKFFGVLAGAWLSVRLGLATLPDGVRWRHLAPIGVLAGIGFTVALFVSGLAFDRPEFEAEAKSGIFAASVVAGIAGYAWLRLTNRPSSEAPIS